MEQILSFIAIELPEEVKAGLGALEDCLKADDRRYVKWVDPNGIHLTLKFLGIVPVSRVKVITAEIEAAAEGISPFRLELKDLGVFPNLKRVQTAWVGLGGELEQLSSLQQRIESGLSHLGFAPENRSWTPHLTLARLRDSATPQERQEFGQLFTGAEMEIACPIKVDSISLMRSQLTPQGAIHSQIATVPLKG